MFDLRDVARGRELVMVSNRLPVDRVRLPDGSAEWRTSPGGLVTAVEPIVRELGCLWVGWAGSTDEEIEPFEIGSMRLAPIPLSSDEMASYYEGFSNGTLWPLYHDVISAPVYHRTWWDSYQRVNRRFAERVAEEAAEGAIVWVHDYQLQLVPEMLRELRPDVTIAFFLHIPFPPRSLFAQLPWRRQITRGLLGADVIGFQRVQDAVNFRFVTERYAGAPARGNTIVIPEAPGRPSRSVLAQEFPISIDAGGFEALAASPEVRHRAQEIREELGTDRTILLGVDRLDYTKGIRHRLKAFEELLEDGEISAQDTVLVQVASPSREQVEAYQRLREEVEVTVGRINGAHGSIGHAPLVYLHRGYSRDEMAALYLAADVAVVTPLRDGMNLVAKEYVACRADEGGALILSEFTGAADELRDALLINPHDIEGVKAAMLRAIHLPRDEQRRRMRSLRRAVYDNDVAHWANQYLGSVAAVAENRSRVLEQAQSPEGPEPTAAPEVFVSSALRARLRRLATAPTLIVASDFDGTLAPIVGRPQDARILPRARQALDVLQESPGVQVILLTGRSIDGLQVTGLESDAWILSASHGAELTGLEAATGGRAGAGTGSGAETEGVASTATGPLSDDEEQRLSRLSRRFDRVFRDEDGVRLERKPFGIVVHTREVAEAERADELLAAAVELGAVPGIQMREGKQVREFSVRTSDKGSALQQIRALLPAAPVLFLGDDVTDEDVFRVLGPDDLGIKVGAGDTAAKERVSDPEAAAMVLAQLSELRTGIVIGTDGIAPH
ncbi:bifunctional alpha,alpha-trehalose-phosphate synthase (UDP-forming)/trehalose-phosphatase [Leucobacter rhizosphaerae]|uniref:Bifunctional alpha,alpha-trehalose-phosphate synthase (UDP-forming)/trehalose-phosphatase n=1 Tax=Leucobacter rhizosphaerae TaxID=2932245 RepID=A0ABY4FV61_9MICO|nr:bifunctional alpha,alpha-trehalose-phosphate synthase (UDP-forming)/trehalose-phosphatase [Leucobacter rhizosphaerae]UOQ60162.1 bifunctional alpha,alpha-trehalose-phosphate synthase (UDP-forming)/trehalose-phosphatase [Leucobacter rhizosphaerae]